MLQIFHKKLNKKGFTLAELLIVVAIVAILAAIAIPVFTSSLDKAKEATDKANLRAAQGASAVAYLNNEYNGGSTEVVNGKYFTTDGTWVDKNGENIYVGQYGVNENHYIKADGNGSAEWVDSLS